MMSPLKSAGALGFSVWIFAGCTVVDSFTTAEVCNTAADVALDIGEVSLLIATNPLGIDTYAEQLRSSNQELKNLKASDSELAAAFDRGTEGIDLLLDALEDPTSENLASLPETIARTQLAFLEVEEICQRFLE